MFGDKWGCEGVKVCCLCIGVDRMVGYVLCGVVVGVEDSDVIVIWLIYEYY